MREFRKHHGRFAIILPAIKFFIFTFYLFTFHSLHAQYFLTPPHLVPYLQNLPEADARAAVLVDAATGALLYSKNPNEEIPPASLAKLMTMHLLMKEIEEGKAYYNDFVNITEESWAKNQPPGSSLMFLAPGQIVTLREIMLGLAVPSGNDAASASALYLAPSMEIFGRMMTEEGRRMGLYLTRFFESSGISGLNITTAEEFAFFCYQYIYLHPDSLNDFHSKTVFTYPAEANMGKDRSTQTIMQQNRNGLLGKFSGVDGLKTGYIEESGYNFALTAKRENTRFLAVILGSSSVEMRNKDGETLLSWAFENFKTVRPPQINLEEARLWKGRENTVEIKLAVSADFTSPVTRANTVFYRAEINTPLTAPLAAGEEAGYLIIYDEEGDLHRVPLITERAYIKGNIIKQLWHSIQLLFKK